MAIAVTTFVGFAPTFFLRSHFHPEPLSALIQLHGIIFAAWPLLLITQAGLVAAHRTDLHRRLGMFAVVLACAMLVVGSLAAVDAARRGVAPGGMDPLVFMAIPFGALAVSAILLTAGLVMRRRPETHKRLMLLATLGILTPAIARLWFVGQRPVLALALTNVFALVAILYDYRMRGRVHPAYLWGGLVLVLSGPLRVAIGHTEAWRAIARALVG